MSVLLLKDNGRNGTLKHRLVSYVMDYDKSYFSTYVTELANEMNKRKIKFKEKYLDELYDFCTNIYYVLNYHYPEHNDRYLRQCLYNLEEKAMRGIISKKEWLKIYNKFKDFTDLWKGK